MTFYIDITRLIVYKACCYATFAKSYNSTPTTQGLSELFSGRRRVRICAFYRGNQQRVSGCAPPLLCWYRYCGYNVSISFHFDWCLAALTSKNRDIFSYCQNIRNYISPLQALNLTHRIQYAQKLRN